MKKVYLAIIERLKSVQSLQFIDLDKGQLDYYETRPNIAYPAALIDFNVNQTTISENVQRVTGQLIIRAAFDYAGETAANAPDMIIEQALSVFDVIDEIKHALQNYSSVEIELIEHTTNQRESRSDGLNVRRLGFEIVYDEEI